MHRIGRRVMNKLKLILITSIGLLLVILVYFRLYSYSDFCITPRKEAESFLGREYSEKPIFQKMESEYCPNVDAFIWTITYSLNGIDFEATVWTITKNESSIFNRWDYCWVRDNYVQKCLEKEYGLSLRNYMGKYDIEPSFNLNVSEYDTFSIYSDNLKVITEIMYDVIDKCKFLDIELSDTNFVFGIYSEDGQIKAHIYYDDLRTIFENWDSTTVEDLEKFISEEIEHF